MNHPTKPSTKNDVSNYVLLLKQLKKTFGPKSLLVTAAVGAPPSRVAESYPQTSTICETLDLVYLMTYDYHGSWEKVMGHHAPFQSANHPDDPDNDWNVKSSVENWIKRGCSPNKLVLGLPTYGRVFKAVDKVERLAPGVTTGVKGKYTREDGFMTYYEQGCRTD